MPRNSQLICLPENFAHSFHFFFKRFKLVGETQVARLKKNNVKKVQYVPSINHRIAEL